MDAQILAFLIQDGIGTGAIYVLISVSLVMIFMVTRIIFVPQGELITFSVLGLGNMIDGRTPGMAYLMVVGGLIAFCLELSSAIHHRRWTGIRKAVLIYVLAPLGLWLASWMSVRFQGGLLSYMLLTIAIAMVMGPILFRIIFQPMASASPLVLLITALAAHFVLISLGLYLFGPDGVRTPGLLESAVTIANVTITYQSLLVVATCIIVNIALFVFFSFSVLGKALRATAINRRGAQLMGISTDLSSQATFAIAGLIGAVSGLLIGPISPIYYDSGFIIGLKGFVGAILGGLASYPLAAIGALCIGMLDSFGAFWASAYKEVLVFTLILPLLFWCSRYDSVDDHA